jgi:hypothetical protein
MPIPPTECGIQRISRYARSVSRENITMILEAANLNIRPGESADFERAFAEAQAISAAILGCGWGAKQQIRHRINGCRHCFLHLFMLYSISGGG